MAINEETLHQLLGKAIVDFGATWNAPLVVIGDKLGLYKALANFGPLTSGELAEHTGTSERYVREWLRAQAAGGYVTYHPETDRYSLSEEQALMFADENSPAFIIGAFQSALAGTRIEPKLAKAFRTGEGIGWDEHDEGLFVGTERFFRTGYAANLVSSWIPALDGVEAKLKEGARVADVGCGHGASTVLMAQAYPNSTFIGFDFHDESIKAARKRAEEAGVSDRVNFEVASSKSYLGRNYDLVTFFDCLHDLGDPVGTAAYVLKTLKKNGTWMIVEPYAGDRVEDNLNPVGRAYYSASTLVCTPCSLDQDVGLALGAQAGEARIREVVMKGGFSRFRRATATPFNLVFEARS
ncbi:MAG TPA: class I SAM-dependent methyltransferase [Thermodesulfobacteriota bacterium]|nr:class I SAM-dependent methyltransferase [Thermodesulfobacteriota bacterium]